MGELANIPIEEIDEGDRYRKDYGNIEELKGSITQRGLIQPLAVMRQEGPKPYKLLAGGRRLRALRLNNVALIPVNIFPANLTNLEQRSIELAENFFRKDLDFREYINLTAEIHSLMQEIHGKKVSTATDAQGWGLSQTAELLGRDKSTVSKDLQMAQMLQSMPEVFSDCKNKKDAEKRMRKIGEELILDQLVSRIKKQPADKARQTLMDCYILKDFFEGVKAIPDNSVNLVEVDPPYGIDLQNQKKDFDAYLGLTDEYSEITSGEYPKFIQSLLSECYRVMTNNSWLIFWFGQSWFEDVYQWILKAGFQTSRMFAAWIKPTGQSMRPEIYLPNTIECFFYARKGDPIISKQGRANSFIFSPVVAERKVHPAERPGELMREILTTFGQPGMRVMVPCCGSGVTLLEAHRLGMQPFGFDLSKKYRDSFLVKVYQMFGGDSVSG